MGCGCLEAVGSEVDTADITDHADSWYLKKDLVFEHNSASVTEAMLADGFCDGELRFFADWDDAYSRVAFAPSVPDSKKALEVNPARSGIMPWAAGGSPWEVIPMRRNAWAADLLNEIGFAGCCHYEKRQSAWDPC